jgi:hypothetical protein
MVMADTKSTFRKITTSWWFLLIVGALLGALLILAIRVATFKHEHTHYHANFAVYINGKREEFKGPQYYKEVATCSAYGDITDPGKRAHMHEEVNSVVHVHDNAVTWEQFFNNIGWTVSAHTIETDSGTMYTDSDTNKVHIIADGQDYTGFDGISSFMNTVIKDRSRVLISFGDVSDQQVQDEYKSVANTAKKYDETKDPSSCSGDETVPFKERLHHLF